MIPDTSAQDRVLAAPPRHRLRRMLPVSLLVVALLGLSGYSVSHWAGSSRSVSAERLRFAEVSRGDLIRDAAVNGRVVAAVSPTLYAPAAGTVSLRIKAGDAITRGDLLAVIDSPELANELARERSTEQQLDAELGRQRILAQKTRLLAQRDADEAELARVAAQRELQRAQRGFELNAIAEVDFLRAQDALTSAEIRSQHAAKAAGLDGKDVELALQTQQQQVQRQRLLVGELERRVEQLQIRAPVDGIVGTLAVADRTVLVANAALLTVVDLSRLEVELEIPESYADDLGIGMSAEITIGSLLANGTLSALSPEVVENRVLARVRFVAEQPAGLRQNQRVSARVLIEERPDVLMLPRGPFVESEGGRFAYVMRDGIAERHPVQLGATSVSAVEILSGLQIGDRVVIAGTDTFAHAERIAINH